MVKLPGKMKNKLCLYLVVFITGLFVISCNIIPTTSDYSKPADLKTIIPETNSTETTNLEIANLETTAAGNNNPGTNNTEITNSSKINSIETIINDMKLPHEGHPHGVPLSWDWAQKPRLGKGNNPGSYKAMTAWGQLYEDAYGNPAKNTRVHIRDIKAYMLSKKDGQWHLLQKSQLVYGAAFREDFAYNYSKTPDFRMENDGSISVKAGNGYNVHFWAYTGRALIEPDDIAGIFTTVQARLIVDNPDYPDDRLQARYLLDMGGDYWLNLDSNWGFLTTNQDIGIGRFRYVTTDWKSFNMHTLSEAQILTNPPPLD